MLASKVIFRVPYRRSRSGDNADQNFMTLTSKMNKPDSTYIRTPVKKIPKPPKIGLNITAIQS